jgi:uncharacterized protein
LLPEVELVTPQEEQLLNSLIERVNSTQLQEKDPDAEALLNKALGPNPDAIYILAQTVLVQNIALEQAKAQVNQLQQQAQLPPPQPARATSFLGGLFGHHEAAQAAPAPPSQVYVPPPPPPPAYGQPQYQQVQPQYAPAQPQYAPVASGGPPSFLRGAMQTAAGVAAGALAFEGVESVLHGLGGFGHSGYEWGGGPGMGMGGFGGPGMMGTGFQRPEETVINNYYDQPGGEERHFRDSSDAGSGQGGAQFSDASYNTPGGDMNDQSGFGDSNAGDNSGYDDSSQDDSSSFDDSGGGFDDGGGGGGGDLL